VDSEKECDEQIMLSGNYGEVGAVNDYARKQIVVEQDGSECPRVGGNSVGFTFRSGLSMFANSGQQMSASSITPVSLSSAGESEKEQAAELQQMKRKISVVSKAGSLPKQRKHGKVTSSTKQSEVPRKRGRPPKKANVKKIFADDLFGGEGDDDLSSLGSLHEEVSPRMKKSKTFPSNMVSFAPMKIKFRHSAPDVVALKNAMISLIEGLLPDAKQSSEINHEKWLESWDTAKTVEDCYRRFYQMDTRLLSWSAFTEIGKMFRDDCLAKSKRRPRSAHWLRLAVLEYEESISDQMKSSEFKRNLSRWKSQLGCTSSV
jgi:hypothetical protein